MSLKPQSSHSRLTKRNSRSHNSTGTYEVPDFDLGTFFNFAEWYDDGPYMNLALNLFEKAPAGTPLHTPTMVSVLSRKFQDSAAYGADKMNACDKVAANQIVFMLPVPKGNGFALEKVSYRLPTDRDRASKDLRLHLLRFLDDTNAGRMTIDELIAGLEQIVTVPNKPNAQNMLEEVIVLAQQAVQDLMLDGAPRHNDDIITKEFRVFLVFLQGYIDLWEIFYEVDHSGDEMITATEFCKCAPKLKAWGLKDPALASNPDHVFAQIDKDESGYVTFSEFADFCVRKGLMQEVAQELQK